MVAFFGFVGMPGPLEILIILFILGIIVLTVAIVIFLMATGKLGSAKGQAPPCPNCSGWVVPQARFCHHCGGALTPPPGS